MRQITLNLPGQVKQAKYVCSVSGGLSSIEAWERTLNRYGPDEVCAVFADVGTVVENGKIVCGEDEDLIRFMDEAEAYIGQPIHRIRPFRKCVTYDHPDSRLRAGKSAAAR